ncbi:MAG: imidazole glycerol phosphate synthase subunit HisH [Acidobacteriota bacterium]
MSKVLSSTPVVIVDYGTGNLNSVKKVLDRMGFHSVVSSSAEDVARAGKLILPGVGHFAAAMAKLRELGLIDALYDAALVRKKPILGICLGMELMAKRSEEGDVAGLGWLDAEMVRFDIADKDRFKVPHMGWNTISIKKSSPLMNNVPDGSEFYFAHSYHLKANDPADVLNETSYGVTFPSAIVKGNIFGVQYHPEKSHDAGAQVVKNFVEM